MSRIDSLARTRKAYRRGVDVLASHGPAPPTTARIGLGLLILLAGVHKLVAPAAWTAYVVPWFEALLPMSPTTWMLLNGWLEILFALPVLANRWVVAFAGFIAASLLATVGYLVVAIAVSRGRRWPRSFGLVLVRAGARSGWRSFGMSASPHSRSP